MRPVEQTTIDPVRGVVERCGQVFRGGARVLEARGPGAGVGAPRVEDDGAHLAVGDGLLGPLHRCSLDPVLREDCRGGVVRAVVDDDGDVALAAVFDAGGYSCRPKA